MRPAFDGLDPKRVEQVGAKLGLRSGATLNPNRIFDEYVWFFEVIAALDQVIWSTSF